MMKMEESEIMSCRIDREGDTVKLGKNKEMRKSLRIKKWQKRDMQRREE